MPDSFFAAAHTIAAEFLHLRFGCDPNALFPKETFCITGVSVTDLNVKSEPVRHLHLPCLYFSSSVICRKYFGGRLALWIVLPLQSMQTIYEYAQPSYWFTDGAATKSSMIRFCIREYTFLNAFHISVNKKVKTLKNRYIEMHSRNLKHCTFHRTAHCKLRRNFEHKYQQDDYRNIDDRPKDNLDGQAIIDWKQFKKLISCHYQFTKLFYVFFKFFHQRLSLHISGGKPYPRFLTILRSFFKAQEYADPQMNTYI